MVAVFDLGSGSAMAGRVLAVRMGSLCSVWGDSIDIIPPVGVIVNSLWRYRIQPTTHYGTIVYNQLLTMELQKIDVSPYAVRVEIYHYITLHITGLWPGRLPPPGPSQKCHQCYHPRHLLLWLEAFLASLFNPQTHTCRGWNLEPYRSKSKTMPARTKNHAGTNLEACRHKPRTIPAQPKAMAAQTWHHAGPTPRQCCQNLPTAGTLSANLFSRTNSGRRQDGHGCLEECRPDTLSLYAARHDEQLIRFQRQL
jgi:hypothetical protein